MKQRLLLTLSMFISLLAMSCNKDSGGGSVTPTVTVTKSDLLTKPTWKLTAMTVDPAAPFTTGGTPVANWYAQLGNCGKDDIYKFNATTYAFEEGASKCNANDPTVWESGTWKFNTTSTVIIMSGTSPKVLNYEFKLSELTATKLVLTREFQNNSSGLVYTLTQTFAPN
jgi:Lipocalin-like domain